MIRQFTGASPTPTSPCLDHGFGCQVFMSFIYSDSCIVWRSRLKGGMYIGLRYNAHGPNAVGIFKQLRTPASLHDSGTHKFDVRRQRPQVWNISHIPPASSDLKLPQFHTVIRLESTSKRFLKLQTRSKSCPSCPHFAKRQALVCAAELWYWSLCPRHDPQPLQILWPSHTYITRNHLN